jgi:hypothetical protein
MNMKQRSCYGRGARSAPFGLAMRPKRRVRAAHGRAREAKTHWFFMFNLKALTDHLGGGSRVDSFDPQW